MAAKSEAEIYNRFKERHYDPTEFLNEPDGPYDKWLEDMFKRPDSTLVPFEFDLENNPEQSVAVPKIEALDPYKNIPDIIYYVGLKLKMVRMLGTTTFKLLDQLKNQQASPDDSRTLVERLAENRLQNKNTLIVTSHFTFPELGLFKGLRFIAERDRPNISNNGVLLNKIMTRQKYSDKKLIDQFKPISNIYFSYPKSESAKKHGVPDEITNLGNALLMSTLKPDLREGGVELDIALTGKQIVTIPKDNGKIDHYKIPIIDLASARLIESFDDMFSATIIKSPFSGEWIMDIGNVVDIKESLKTMSSAEIVDALYMGIKESIEHITCEDVVYTPIVTSLGKTAINNSDLN